MPNRVQRLRDFLTNCQGLLTELEQANLFLVPLDDERIWYRYHHLFADFLRTELSKIETKNLYKRAALWHEQNDFIVGRNRLPPLGSVESLLGGIALERNDLAAAEGFLQRGIALSRRGGLIDDVILGLSVPRSFACLSRARRGYLCDRPGIEHDRSRFWRGAHVRAGGGLHGKYATLHGASEAGNAMGRGLAGCPQA